MTVATAQDTTPSLAVALHVDQLWATAPGGIGRYTRELWRALESLGDDAPIVLPFRSQDRDAAAVPDVDDVVVVPGSIRRLYPQWDLLGRPHLPVRVTACDLVHAPSHAAVPPAGRGQRLVVTVHDLAFERYPDAFPRTWRWMYRAGLRAAVRRADAILVPSEATREDLLLRTGIDPDRVHLTPLGASAPDEAADPAPVLERLHIEPPYVLFVGTLEPRKGIPSLIRAYRRVSDRGLPHALVLAGAVGWGAEEVSAAVAQGGPGRVIRTGNVTDADLEALYRGADVFAYPSRYEGFGLPVLEAMARGVPVVTTETSALPEVGGEAVFYVPPADDEALAIGLERILLDEALAADLRRDGLARAATFSWERTARATLDVYRRVSS